MTTIPDGNTSTLQEIKALIQSGAAIEERTRDILLFSAIIDIYALLNTSASENKKKFTQINATIDPIARAYKWAAWAIGIGGSVLIGLAVTGKIEIIIK